MDFGALPPEINSGKMYAGPGAGSMLIAASAWESVADELYSTASSAGAVITALTDEPWLGEASVAMVTAATPYLGWLTASAAQAQHTAAQMRAAAGAFEAAFAATVPPPVIAANRTLLLALTATNVLGINTPAIATVEAHYGEMWAQDAAAMYGYAGASAAASVLTAFTSPVNGDGSHFLEDISMLSSLVSPLSSVASTMSSSMSAMSSMSSVAKAFGSSATAVESLGREATALGTTVTNQLTGLALPAAEVSAEVGGAMSLGPLSVPRSWATLTGAVGAVGAPSSAAARLPGVGSVSAVQPVAGAGSMLGGLPISMTARGEGSGTAATFRAGFRPTVLPRSL
ncbi:PPE family protein [Mycobacterium angelicum]|uniref:PPE family protein n=1 Tax=Mycobacterium angelicum TaxID=470074 RepID=A0A1W9ZNY2_MYCAN|nr:PPE family protein [Mycobacterium angelicum]MCV7198224.1 PPE family protein [Mycobacterium angelicum]ORA19511.1 hypothetical protein BST12_16915 [Mycobacterium angelicum]